MIQQPVALGKDFDSFVTKCLEQKRRAHSGRPLKWDVIKE